MKSICEIDSAGVKRWYNEQRHYHRKDGPAVEYSNGYKDWYVNGLLHREDGPAVERDYGKSYYYHGQYIKCDNDEEFQRLIKLKAFW